jgi:hypothetical protein
LGLAFFFVFGTVMPLVAALALVVRALEPIWTINPSGYVLFRSMGVWAFVLLATLSVACGSTAVGLFRARRWGFVLALVILSTQLIGDVINVARGDLRAAIGIPIVLVMIVYLVRVRGYFSSK